MLTKLAGAMRQYGCNLETIQAALLTENDRRCVPPLDAAEVEKVAHRMCRYAPASLSGFVSCKPKESDLARNESWEPIPITELVEDEPLEWLWEGFIPRGGIVLLSGVPKSGKTTLMAHILKNMKDGGNLAGKIEPGRVLVITEEGGGLWLKRREELSLGGNIDIIPRPFMSRGAPKPAGCRRLKPSQW